MHVKYEFIREQKAEFSVNMLCKMMKVSQSGYFSWASRKPSKRTNENSVLGEKMCQIFEKSRNNYGKRRIHAQLVREGFACGLKRVARLMQTNHLKVKTRRKFKSTTD